jgi:hypothetical protein
MRSRFETLMLKSMLLAVAIVAALSSAGWGFDQSAAAKDANAAAENWLKLVDAGKFNASWLEASTYFRNAVTKQDWKRQVALWRSALGPVVSRQLKTEQFVTTLPGAPDGQYMLIQYDTRFAHKQSAVEIVTPMVDADGTWRVSEYSIK